MSPKTKILFLVGFLLLGLTFPLYQAHASLFGHIFSILFNLIFQISYWFSKLAINLLTWVTSENFIAWSYTGMDNPVIQQGWRLTRDFVSMLFIIVLAFIGLATALRIREYEAQKLLPILLITLFLINFSHVLCGIVVDASNIIMNHFLNAFGQGKDLVGNKIQDRYDKADKTKWYTSVSDEMPLLTQMLVLSIFNFFAGIIYFLFCFIFAFRYVAIWICVILSPVAFGANVLPATKGFFKKWLNWFLQWCFIGVIAMFFLYLGDHIMVKTDTGFIADIIRSKDTNFLEDIVASVAPMSIGLIFLMFGFQSALSGGAMGAQYAIGLARWTGSKATKLPGVKQLSQKMGPPKEWAGKAKDWAGSSIKKQMREHMPQIVRAGLQRTSTIGPNFLEPTVGESRTRAFGKWVGRQTIGRGYAVPRAIGKLALPESELEEIEAIKAEIKKEKSIEAKLNWLRSNMQKSRAHRVAFMQAAKEEGILEDLAGLPNGLKEKEILRMGSDAAKVGSEAFAPIMKAYPTLVGEMIKDASWRTKEKLGLSEKSMTEWATKNAEKIVHEFALEDATEITDDFVRKRLIKLQGMKITSKLKPANYANVSFDHLDWDAIHLFASGRELGAGAREMGSKFVDKFMSGTDIRHNKKPYNFYYEIPEEKDENGAVIREKITGINEKIGRYLETNAANELGFRKPKIITSPSTPVKPLPTPTTDIPPEETGPRQEPPLSPKRKKTKTAERTGPQQKPPL